MKNLFSTLSIAAVLGLGSLSAMSAEATSEINPLMQDVMASEKAVESLNAFQNKIFDQVNQDLAVKVNSNTTQNLENKGYTMNVTVTMKAKKVNTIASTGL